MYPHAPQSHRPTNYWYVLAACVVFMLVVLLIFLRAMTSHFSPAGAPDLASVSQPSASPRLQATQLASAAAQAAAASVSPSVAPTPSGVIDVTPQQLQDSPATYRSRIIRVQGTVFYTGQVEAGKTWIQIQGPNNVYVDGVIADPLPNGVTKGANVTVTGVGAGLTNITATNGKDYDQAYIDPIQKIEITAS